MSDEEGPCERSPSPPRVTPYPAPLPVSPLRTRGHEHSQSQHFTLFLSLAAEVRDEAIESADPAFGNFLRNVRDHDIGVFSTATAFVGRGASFTVRRTTISDHKTVVFKSSLRAMDREDKADEARRLEAVLLELRVLTHPPLRAHDNIVSLLQVGWEGDAVDISRKWPVLVMEYADQGTLVDYFDHEPQLPFSTRKMLCTDVANGLLALHNCGIIHGDLKLENVLVFSVDDGRSVRAKLSDFGGALLDSDILESIPMATPPWNAPEWRVDRPRSRLITSDIYSLGMLIWRVVLNGKNPFDDTDLFPACPTKAEQFAMLDTEKAMDELFLGKARQSVSKWDGDVDQELISNVLSASIRTAEGDRDLNLVLDLLGSWSQRSNAATNVQPSFEARTDIMKHNEPLRFSFEGLNFTGATAPLRPKILESMNIALADGNIERRLEAAVALTMTNLASDDFGLGTDVDAGLQFLILAAELGSRQYQALALRFHEAFGRSMPDSVASKVVDWLSEAAATGSMTALEDLREHGYHDEAEKSRALLQTRYCGVGIELFEYEPEAAETLQSMEEMNVFAYLEAQLKEGQDAGKDISGYLLRLAAAYGSSLAIGILAAKFFANVNDANEMQEAPLLFAARSGHLDALLTLLHLGANPKVTNLTDDTPLHWLCSFSDNDIREAATALVCAGANVNAQAEIYPDEEGFDYAETDYVAGTPLHRAVAMNSPLAVRTLLDLGADPHSSAGNDTDLTPFALAVLLHYPETVSLFLSKAGGEAQEWLLLPSGKSILTCAMSGGTLYGSTMGRLIRHGPHQVSRAEKTLAKLLEAGAANHIHDLPGMSGCTAVLYAAQNHVSVLEFLLRNGADADIDTPSERPPVDEEEDMRRPPLFEAVAFGKLRNVSALLRAGASAQAVMNPEKKLPVLYYCAENGFEDTATVEQFLQKGVDVDNVPPDFETPFACAVINRCFKLAGFLRERGANPNILYRRGLMSSSTHPSTILERLAIENSQGSISCLAFLLSKTPGLPAVSLSVEPSRNHTVFHTLATIPGDSQDPIATTLALSLCGAYFDPTPADLNHQTLPVDTCHPSVVSAGGNTALHLTVIHANLEVIRWLLLSVEGVDTSIRNESGFTPLDLAALAYPEFHRRFEPVDVPRHPRKQLEEARLRRRAIWRLLESFTPGGVTQGVTDKYTLDEDDDGDDGELIVDIGEKDMS